MNLGKYVHEREDKNSVTSLLETIVMHRIAMSPIIVYWVLGSSNFERQMYCYKLMKKLVPDDQNCLSCLLSLLLLKYFNETLI